MQAIIYGRWSSLEQGRGTTLERQLEACEDFCRNAGFKVARTLFDEGRSAYTGDNIKSGELGKLTNEITAGLLPPDTVLVVEQLDRLSRLPPLDVLAWLQKVTSLGVIIRTAKDGAVISQEEFVRNPTGVMSLVLDACRAFMESHNKSRLVGSAWTIKRADAAQGNGRKITSICPAWLRLDKAANEFVPLDDRVEVVRRIFDLADKGWGKLRIARHLNAENVEPWGRGKSKGTAWGASYIHKITANTAVLGDYQPCQKAKADARRTPVGDVIKGYFPPIINEAQFARVNDRKAAQDRRAGRKGELKNVFSGVATCSACKGRMKFVNKGSAGTMRKTRSGSRKPILVTRRADESYLVCEGFTRGICVNGKQVRYGVLEAAILGEVLHLAMGNGDFEDATAAMRLESELASAQRSLAMAKEKAARMLELYRDFIHFYHQRRTAATGAIFRE